MVVWPTDIDVASGCSKDYKHLHGLRWKHGPWTSAQIPATVTLWTLGIAMTSSGSAGHSDQYGSSDRMAHGHQHGFTDHRLLHGPWLQPRPQTLTQTLVAAGPWTQT